MTQTDVMTRVRENQEALRELGVASLAVFGSTARDEATDSSDVDLLVEFRQPVGLFTFYRVEEFLERILGTDHIDLVLRRAVVDELRERVYAEAIPCLVEAGRSASAA